MKSYSFYKKKLEDLDIFQTSLTPTQYVLYKPRIEDIRKNINQQVKLTDTYTPFIQSFEPYISDEAIKKKSKKDHAKKFFQTYNTAYMGFHGANTKQIDQETVNKAKMIKAGKFYYEDGYNKANMYLEQNDVPFYIDDGLSNDLGIVLVRKGVSDTGQIIHTSSAFPQEVKIAYRGTNLTDISDLRTDKDILINNLGESEQYSKVEGQLRKVINKYNDPSELIGYSKGSALAIRLGEEFGYKTTNFNPFIGIGVSKLKSGNHRVIRTTGDVPSFGIAGTAQSDNFKVESLEPHTDSLWPVTIHSIDNFTESKPRQSELERQTKILNIRKTARKLADAESLVKINNYRKNRLYDRPDFREINSNKESISFNHVKQKVKDIVKSGISKMKKIKQVGQTLRNRFDSPAQSIYEEKPLLGDDEFEDVSLEMDELYPSTRLSGGAPKPASEDVIMLGGGSGDGIGPVAVPLEPDAPPPPIFGPVVDEAPSLDLNDLQARLNALSIVPPQQNVDVDVEMTRLDEANVDLPNQFNQFFTGRRTGEKSFTDYIHSLDAGGTEITQDGAIKLSGDGFKNQRALWELSGGDFTSQEQEHFSDFPRDTSFETELSPAEISKINDGNVDVHNEFIDDLSLENQNSFMQLHSVNQVPSINEVSTGSRVRSAGTNLILGVGSQYAVDTGLDLVDPEHKKIQEDVRQGISGFMSGGMAEAGALKLAGSAVTAEAILPVAIGAGVGSVAAYETDKWFANNAPKQVYLRDISDGMVGMGAAGATTGLLLGGPMGGLIGGGIGLATGFLFGTGEYLYQKYL